MRRVAHTRPSATELDIQSISHAEQGGQSKTSEILEQNGISWPFILEHFPLYGQWIQNNFTRQPGKHFPDNLEPDLSAKSGVLTLIITMYKHFGPLNFIRLNLSERFSDLSELSTIFREGKRVVAQDRMET